MSKINRVESFDLGRFLADGASGGIESGNVYYHSGGRHTSHLDLHVNFPDGGRASYRLYRPVGADPFLMEPGQNLPFRFGR
jgi:hypothetical protein